MGGATKVILIDEKGQLTPLISYTGAENDLFFSEDFLKGNIQKAIDSFIDSSNNFHQNSYCKDEPLTFAPYHYGLNILDFKNKEIHSLTTYDRLGVMNMLRYSMLLRDDKYIKKITQENLLHFVDENLNKPFSIQEFFGTTNSKLVCQLLKSKENRTTGEIKNYKNVELDNLGDFHIKPHNLDWSMKRYQEYEISEYFIDLNQKGFHFSKEDLESWLSYAKNLEALNAHSIIEDYITSFNEKSHLEKIVKVAIEPRKQKL
jgi:hypothetical protein